MDRIKITEQSHEIIGISDNILKTIEKAGRTCYKSEDKINEYSAKKFVGMIIKRGHEAMLEFGDITVKFITNRGVTHELVRHRLCSFAQESTRYVKYDEVEFIRPVWLKNEACHETNIWMEAIMNAARDYRALLEEGWKPQQAREVLPNSLKTEIIVKANVREWRNILKLRCPETAHPQMFSLMRPLLEELKNKIPVIFDDIQIV